MSLILYLPRQSELFIDALRFNLIRISPEKMIMTSGHKKSDITVWCNDQWPEQTVIHCQIGIRECVVTDDTNINYDKYSLFLFDDINHANLFRLVFSDIVVNWPEEYEILDNDISKHISYY